MTGSRSDADLEGVEWLKAVTYVEVGPEGERVDKREYVTNWERTIRAAVVDDLILRKVAGRWGITMHNLLDRISINPNVCFGKPCIKGTRIWVSLILDFLANGDTEAEILESYPQLSHEDILAAIAYGAEMSRERIIPVPTERSA